MNRRDSGGALEEVAEQGGGVLAEAAVVRTEGGGKVRINVEFADDLAVDKYRDNDFGFGFERAGEIAGIGADVVYDDGCAGGSRGAADALVERNASVRRHCALEGAEGEHVAIAFLFEHVEADPVVAGEVFMEERNDGFHQGAGGCGRLLERIESGNEVRRFCVRGSHG
jgi:hypothetical protein